MTSSQTKQITLQKEFFFIETNIDSRTYNF